MIPKQHPTVPQPCTAVILVHLGTPEKPTPKSIRRFLAEFLADRRVIEAPRWLWWLILNCFILPFRPRKIQHAYQAIWDHERQQSPLRSFAEDQCTLLKPYADKLDIGIHFAMRYGQPSIDSVIKTLHQKGARKILIAPLYPQYSATTTASVRDEVYRTLISMRWQPNVRFIDDYADHPSYIDTISASIQKHLNQLSWQPDLIIASYHGLPQSYFQQGDPYHCFCLKTTRLICEQLQLDKDTITSAFQSRFGRAQWLQPYLEPLVASLPEKGVKKIVIVAPGFSVDCLETLEEINIGIRETFLEAGGECFSYIPCINADDSAITLYQKLLSDALSGWVAANQGVADVIED
ncbi:MAG: ferrochelatase [Candidatus Comchoanobacterales bacterium]